MTRPEQPTDERFPDLTASEALDAGLCSAQCLLAREPGGTCDCVCGGEFHGAMISMVVPGSGGVDSRPWWERARYVANYLLPPVVTPSGARLALKRSRQERRPAIFCEPDINRYRVTYVGWPGINFDRVGASALDKFTWEWSQRRPSSSRSTRAFPTGFDPNGWAEWVRISSPREAQHIALIVHECWMGNPEGAREAVAALRDNRRTASPFVDGKEATR